MHPSIKAIIDAQDNPATFAALAANHPWLAGEVLVEILPLLQERAALAEALQTKLPYNLRDLLTTWLPRTLLLHPASVAAWIKHANARVRSIDPTFPGLDEGALQIESQWPYGSIRVYDGRSSGRGFVARVRSEDTGPAEVIHIEEWSAVAHLVGGVRTLAFGHDSLPEWEMTWEHL